MKKAAYYEEAKRLYVQEAFALDTIVKLLKNEVSERTLFNWKKEHGWDEQRQRFLESQSAMQDDLADMARSAIKEAKINPTPHNIYAVTKALYALKILQGIRLDDDAMPDEKKSITGKTIAEIERDILGLGNGQPQSGGQQGR